MIENFIVHRVVKAVGAGETKIQTRPDVLAMSEAVITLVDEILTIYNNKSARAYGVFNPDLDNYPFASYTEEYLLSNSNFVDYTIKSLKRLSNKIKDVTLATGGYIAFIHYKTETKNYIMVVMLNDKYGTAIDESTLEINKTIHLDLNKLHFAARLNVTDWKSGSTSKYLSFIKGRGTDGISQYFREFVGCDEFTDSKRLTEMLILAIKDFGGSKNLNDQELQQLRRLAFDYCEDKRKKKESVSLEDLSNRVWERQPEDFLSFANSEKYQLASTFEPHRDVLRRLYRFSGKDKGLAISFDSELLGSRIHYKKDTEILTIQGLPKDLKADLDEKYGDPPTET
ncbi:nucleoid-associated protein [Geobacter sp.]|uniref:nucleoid-associated protein n=1 Tax=Geobacter sp. TaxID=46610 RepID=UPI0027BA5B25|nr:nucleoid-associated protein [Geobacter sp.]